MKKTTLILAALVAALSLSACDDPAPRATFTEARLDSKERKQQEIARLLRTEATDPGASHSPRGTMRGDSARDARNTATADQVLVVRNNPDGSQSVGVIGAAGTTLTPLGSIPATPPTTDARDANSGEPTFIFYWKTWKVILLVGAILLALALYIIMKRKALAVAWAEYGRRRALADAYREADEDALETLQAEARAWERRGVIGQICWWRRPAVARNGELPSMCPDAGGRAGDPPAPGAHRAAPPPPPPSPPPPPPAPPPPP